MEVQICKVPKFSDEAIVELGKIASALYVGMSPENPQRTARRLFKRAGEISANKLQTYLRDFEKGPGYRFFMWARGIPQIMFIVRYAAEAEKECDPVVTRVEIITEFFRLPDDLMEVASPVPLDKVRFSRHSIEQLQKRFQKKVRNYYLLAFDLLSKASFEGAISRRGKVKRLIDNNFVEVFYLKNGAYRFVIKEMEDGTFKVLTIEEAYLK
ncbi:hypothetical protein HYT01_02025 [Candidatus Giovannonibacteria bacterium]|nr:hypothetical protein [Candidatus Giovannonibacteria bacterium]